MSIQSSVNSTLSSLAAMRKIKAFTAKQEATDADTSTAQNQAAPTASINKRVREQTLQRVRELGELAKEQNAGLKKTIEQARAKAGEATADRHIAALGQRMRIGGTNGINQTGKRK